MKNFKTIFLPLIFLASALILSSCESQATDADKQGKEYTSTYICPMHCEGSGSDKAGTCPVCKMAYIQNETKAHEGHSHDGHDHEGHSH
ncbi:MAG: hypothetical protein ACI8YQ_000890 [Polaribacter sp.]|jgi:hypothetical protein